MHLNPATKNLMISMLLGISAIENTVASEWQYSWDYENHCPIVYDESTGEWKELWPESGEGYITDYTWANKSHTSNDNKGEDFGTITESTMFYTGLNPAKITGVGEHINIFLQGTKVAEQMGPPPSDFYNVDTIYLGTVTDSNGNENGFRIRLANSDLISSYNAIYCDGGQLWFYNLEKPNVTIEVNTDLYIGGTKFDDSNSRYHNRGLNADIRAEGPVTFGGNIYLIDNARIITMLSSKGSTHNETIFTSESIIYGNGFDLELGAVDESLRKSIPYQIYGNIEDVRSIVLGGSQLENINYGKVTATFGGTINVGSFTICNDSVVNITSDAEITLDNKGYRGSWDYAILFEDKDNKGIINFPCGSMTRNADNILDSEHGKSLGLIEGNCHITTDDTNINISGDAVKISNILITLDTSAILNIDNVLLSSYHQVTGINNTSVINGNFSIDLTNEYATNNITLSGELIKTNTTETIGFINMTDKVSQIDYTGLKSLTLGSGSTVTFNFIDSVGTNDYIAVKFNDVIFDPSQIKFNGIINGSTYTGYYISEKDNMVIFQTIPEPTMYTLWLLGVSLISIRRKRK